MMAMKQNKKSVSKQRELFEEADNSLSPPLKWAGGKRWLLPILRSLYAPYRKKRLVEPFAGGLAVALGLHPGKALLSDINPHVISFYKALQKGLKINFVMKNASDSYYRHRSRFNELVLTHKEGTAEAAGLFYYLNRTCYNGLCRFNSRGLFNVPFGKYSKINYTKDFRDYAPALSGWQFRCGDFSKLKLSKTDFVYADPPFDVEFTKYAKDDFKWEDQVRLAEWLSQHKGPVVASNQATPRILDLYGKMGFRIQILSAPRMISCTGDRSRAKEMLATRNVE